MKIVRIVCCLFLLLMGLVVIYQPSTALAQDETTDEEDETPVEETVELSSTYPTLEGYYGDLFTFNVELFYQGSEDRYFDLLATGPTDWSVFVVSSEQKTIAGMTLEPGKTYGQTVEVKTFAPLWLVTEPGEYEITLEAISGEIRDSIDLKVVITARYSLSLVSLNEPPLSTKATAGKDSYFSVEVYNGGTAVIDDITLSSSKPSGWTISLSLDKVDSLAVGDSQTIDVNIKPPPKTIVGDYSITLTARGARANPAELDIRVTVETPTVWGWVGVGIIVLVIAGLAFVFMRFSRR
ncbi:hypothetical protein ES703_96526 [subsurface metagenome]